MVKTPRTRHSKSTKDPVTIDLEADAVSRVANETDGVEATANDSDAERVEATESVAAEQVSEQPAKPEAGAEEAAKKARATASDPVFGRKEPSASPAPTRGGRSGSLASGVAGGVVALLLAGGLHVAGLLPLGTSAPQADHAPAIAALEAQLADVRAQISALEGLNGTDPALEGRVAGTEERVTALATAIEAVRKEIAALSMQEGVPAQVDLSPLESRIAALETALAAIEAAEPPQVDLSALEAGLSTLRAETASARAAQEAASGRIEALEQAVARLGERVDEQAEAPSTAIIIAASALKAAIDRGVPFTAELDTFAALAPDAPQLAGLRTHAAAGLATRAQLEAESDAAANAIISAAVPINPEAGVVDRLWASAMGLVQVRPIGMVEGSGVPEIVARMDAAVEAGDYERAIAEFATLPEAAKAAGASFMARLQARHEAEQLVDAALAAALRS